MKPRASIGCIVLRDDDEGPVLLLKRAFGSSKGEWCFVGGHVEPGESARAAAEREVLEETGLRPQRVCFLRTFHGRASGPQSVFVAHVRGALAITLNREHSDWRWSSPSQAEGLLPVPAQRRALRLALAQAGIQ